MNIYIGKAENNYCFNFGYVLNRNGGDFKTKSKP